MEGAVPHQSSQAFVKSSFCQLLFQENHLPAVYNMESSYPSTCSREISPLGLFLFPFQPTNLMHLVSYFLI